MLGGWLEGEEEEAAGCLPEHLLRNKHVGPLAAQIVKRPAHGRVEAGNEAHALQLGQQVAASEHSISFNIDAPVTARPPVGGRASRIVGAWERPGGRRLVKIPVEADPQHHGQLASGRGWLFVFGGRRVRDGRDVEAVIAQRRLGEGVDVWLVLVGSGLISSTSSRRRALFVVCWLVNRHGIRVVAVAIASIILVLGVDDYGPANGEGRVMVSVQVVALEEEARKDGLYGEGLAIRQVGGGRAHDACRGSAQFD